MSNGSNALTVYSKIQDPLEFIDKFGGAIARSRMFGCHDIDQGKVLAMACLAEGTNPLDISRRYHVIDGNLSMKYDAMLAEFRARGGKYEVITRANDEAEIKVTIDGEEYKESLTWEDAQKEPYVRDKKGEIKKNWATPRARRQMLWARVVSEAVRVMCPEIVAGVYVPEELDVDPEPTSPPPQPQQQEPAAKEPEANSIVDAEFTIAGSTSNTVEVNGPTEGIQLSDIAGNPESVDTQSAEVSTMPVTDATVAEIKSAIVEFGSSSAKVVERIQQHLRENGLNKIADMTQPEAEALLSDLKERAIERFFERSLKRAS